MKSLTEQLWFEVPGRRGFVNITETVQALVRKSGVQEGLCLVNAMHITASVFINDAEEVFVLYTQRAKTLVFNHLQQICVEIALGGLFKSPILTPVNAC